MHDGFGDERNPRPSFPPVHTRCACMGLRMNRGFFFLKWCRLDFSGVFGVVSAAGDILFSGKVCKGNDRMNNCTITS